MYDVTALGELLMERGGKPTNIYLYCQLQSTHVEAGVKLILK
jgi:hypothetical protein